MKKRIVIQMRYLNGRKLFTASIGENAERNFNFRIIAAHELRMCDVYRQNMFHSKKWWIVKFLDA